MARKRVIASSLVIVMLGYTVDAIRARLDVEREVRARTFFQLAGLRLSLCLINR